MITPRDGQSVPDQSTGLRGLKSLGVYNLKPGVFCPRQCRPHAHQQQESALTHQKSYHWKTMPHLKILP